MAPMSIVGVPVMPTLQAPLWVAATVPPTVVVPCACTGTGASQSAAVFITRTFCVLEAATTGDSECVPSAGGAPGLSRAEAAEHAARPIRDAIARILMIIGYPPCLEDTSRRERMQRKAMVCGGDAQDRRRLPDPGRVFEGHPEVTFTFMGGGHAVQHRKNSDAGSAARVALGPPSQPRPARSQGSPGVKMGP